MDERTIGTIVGMVVGAALMILIIKVFMKRKNLTAEYDERQSLIIGQAYKYAFFAMAVCEVLLTAVSAVGLELPILDSVIHFLVIVVGVMVYGCYAVWKGAYWGILDEKQYRTSVRFLIAVGLINYISAGISIAHNDMIEAGKLQPSFINLVCGIMITVILVLSYIRSRSSEDEMEE